ncbi:MAG: hypothetical protein C0602_13520 [Denitrovibrio sp.]|nr:MAG: hypothetical protein C0602_13520 [Denitrovibrio sp.]
MEIFEQILKEAERASNEQDLPDVLLAEIKQICAYQDKYKDSYMLDDLLGRLINYEPFGDVGCGNDSFSTADVQRVVDIILDT